MLTPESLIAVILASFLGGVGGFVSGFFLLMLLKKLLMMWRKHTGEHLPRNIVKRGLAVASGPIIFALFSVVRIFYSSQTGSDYPHLLLLGFYAAGGVYFLFMSAFIFTMFEQLYKLSDIRLKKQNDFSDV